jgi:undecaprenyl-diphosphatase
MRLHPAVPAAAWTAALAGFAVLAAFAAANDNFPADEWLTHRLQDVDSGAFHDVLRVTRGAGDMPFLPIAWVTAAALAAALIGRWQGLLVMASMAGRLANTGVKELVERPRPSADAVEVSGSADGFSFPSGHAAGAVLLFGLIFCLATTHLRDWRLRLAAQAASAWMIIGTGLERVYVGHHWPSDVAGGYYFGALIVACLVAAERSATSRRRAVPLRRPIPAAGDSR